MPLNIPSRSYGMPVADSDRDVERRLKELESFVFQDLRRLSLERKGVLRVASDGSIQIGPASGYVDISKTDGSITLTGAAKYERHIQIPVKADGTVDNQATQVDFFTVGGNQYATTGEKYGYCQFEVPYDWDGGNIYFEVDWFPDSGAMSGTAAVEWTVEYRAVAEGELINRGTSVTLSSIDNGDYAQYQTKHARVTMAYNNANQPLTVQDHVFVKISRNTATANDFSGSVTVSGYEVIYTSKGFPTAN